MPMAAPVMASSDSGVPKTRSGPYLSASPRVVPWIAFGSSTSRPKTITAGSRAISWSAASRTASTNDSVRSEMGAALRTALSRTRGEGIGFLLEDVRREFRRRGERARFREGEGVREFLLDLILNAHPVARGKRVRQLSQRVGGDPRLALDLRAV